MVCFQRVAGRCEVTAEVPNSPLSPQIEPDRDFVRMK